MQRGIDSFFKKVAPQPSSEEKTKSKKRPAQLVSSDDEDVPLKQKTKASNGKKCRLEALKSPKIEKPLKGLKVVNPAEAFGNEHMRSKEKGVHKDNSLNESLHIDEKIKKENHVKKNTEKLPVDEKIKKENLVKNNTEKLNIDEKIKKENHVKKNTEKLEKLEKHDTKIKKETENHNKRVAKDEDDDFIEMKKSKSNKFNVSFMNYQNRPTCLNPGSKEMPKGAPGCLSGLTFLVTGILESFERDEINEFVTNLGGKVSKTVGKKLNFLISGEESGPKKMEDAEKFGVKVISEDELFEMVRLKSNLKNSSASNDDTKSNAIKVETKISPVKENVEKQHVDTNGENSTLTKNPGTEFVNENNIKLALVDKYKPTSTNDIIGQQGDAGNVKKLKTWLMDWFKNHAQSNNDKSKAHKTNGWMKNNGRTNKAALLSGPPGVGKTTTAVLVCKELDFDIVELNASDTRNKRLLKEEVAELLTNKSLYSYIHGQMKTVSKKHVLIMDEVDGMAGNEDRGGIQELIGFIKESSVPIICICNDRNHQKMRSLVNYCYDLRFNTPRLEQIKGKIMSICFRENIKLPPAKIDEIIKSTNNDIRQTINHLAFASSKSDKSLEDNSSTPNATKNINHQNSFKDIKLGPWEVIRKMLMANENKTMNLYEKIDLFFHDYSMMPLFMQQNYLQTRPAVEKSKILGNVALAADALSMGDVVDRCIRSSSTWSLLPTLGVLSFVYPGECMKGNLTGQINFPAWLGKNSRYTKRKRLSQEIYDHTRIITSGSRISIRMDYAPNLLNKIAHPLKSNGVEGVKEALLTLQEYRLLREDIESLIELTSWNNQKSVWDGIDSRVKSALTRAYNKGVMAYSYSSVNGTKKKTISAPSVYELKSESEEEEICEEESEETDEVIKKKKTATKKPKK